MLLHFTDPSGREGSIKVRITTDHPASSYGHPMIVFEDGAVLDMIGWLALGYRVTHVSQEEHELLAKTAQA